MNILFIHEVDYFGKPIYEIHEFPEHLAKLGHNVTFLEFNEVDRALRPNRSRQISGRVLPAVTLKLETPFYFGIQGLDRILAVFTVVPKLYWLLKNRKFDAVVLYAVPTYGLQSIVLSKIFRVPLVHRALDVPHKIRKSFYEPLIRISEKLVYKFSPRISANNQSLASYCDSVGSRQALSAVQLPPLDLSSLTHKERSKTLAGSLGLSDSDRVIAYLGSFFYFSGLSQVIEDFAKVSAQKPDLKLMLIGGGEQDRQLRSQVSRLKIAEKVVFTGFIPFAKISDYLALAHVAINPMESVISSNLALPHKVFQYMACGLPVVSTKLSGLHATLGEDSGLTWVEGPKQVLQAAIKLLDSKEINNSATLAHKSLEEKFDMNRVIGDFEKFIFEF